MVAKSQTNLSKFVGHIGNRLQNREKIAQKIDYFTAKTLETTRVRYNVARVEFHVRLCAHSVILVFVLFLYVVPVPSYAILSTKTRSFDLVLCVPPKISEITQNQQNSYETA